MARALLLLLLVAPALAGAEPGTSREELAGAGIVLIDAPGDAAFDDALVDSLAEGLRRLPPAMRRVPGDRLEIALHRETSAFGMGDGSSARPEWTNGLRRFHLYGFGPVADRRAEWRLEGLSLLERQKLWRERAIVHAVLQRFEEVHHFSERRAWRRLDGWLFPFERVLTFEERALNTFSGAFSRARGEASARLDLVTFAEERFVPVESLREDALPSEDRVACQELSKSRVLDELLFEAKLLAAPPSPPRCSVFERWAELETLSHLEVMLVASTGRRPESLFGHVLLRPVHADGEHVRGPTFDTAIQIAALTDGPERGPTYLFRGVFGGYRITVLTLSMSDFGRETLELEQRTIRRFRLNLPPALNRRVLERAFELERRGYFNYQFFTDNCATVLAWLIEGALDEGTSVQMPGTWIVSPTSALDGLAAARVRTTESDGTTHEGPLLSFEPGSLPSTGESAARAEEHRARSEEEVLEAAGAERESFAAALEKAHRSTPGERAEAYRRLADASDRIAASRPSVAPALYDWWANTVRVERYALDLSERERMLLDAKRLAPATGPAMSPDAEVRERQDTFERESRLSRDRMILDRLEKRRDELVNAPRRPLTDDERALLGRIEEEARTFQLLTSLHGDLIERRFADVDPLSWLARGRTDAAREEAEVATTSLPSSGCWRTTVGAGVHATGTGSSPLFTLHSAALVERFGEQRTRGLNPGAEVHILEGEVQLTPRVGLPEVVRSRFTLFDYRSMVRDQPMYRASFLDHFGWGLGLHADTRPERSLPNGAEAEGELLAVLDASPRFERFTAFGLGASALALWGPTSATPGLGPRVSLRSRLPLGGHGANALRFEASFHTAAVRRDGSSALLSEGTGLFRLELLVGRLDAVAVLVSPQLSLDVTRERGTPLAHDLTSLLTLEAVTF